MTIKELIEKLQEYPETAEVLSIEADMWQHNVGSWNLKDEVLFDDSGQITRMLILDSGD